MSNLSDKEKTALDLYMKRVQELLDNPVNTGGKQKLTVSFSVNMESGELSDHNVDLFDTHEFKSFMMTIRQMIMDTEKAVNFDDICEIVVKRCNQDAIKNEVILAQKVWKDTLGGRCAITDTQIGENITKEELLGLWMYSGRFHTDPNRAAKWDSLPDMLKNELLGEIQTTLHNLLAPLTNVGNAIVSWSKDSFR